MDKKSKLLLAIILALVALLAGLVFWTSYKVASIETNYRNLADGIQNIKVINGINGQNGTDGLNGSNGINGRDGTDSLSTNVIEKFYIQPPAEKGESGSDGAPGKDAEEQQIQLNPETKNLETKKTSERFWTIIIPCSELLRSCPGDVLTKAEQ